MLVSGIHPHDSTIDMSTKKDAQLESCEVTLIWGKIRTAALETVLQVAQRDCSKEAVGEGQSLGDLRYFGDLGEGEGQCNHMLLLQKVFCWS